MAIGREYILLRRAFLRQEVGNHLAFDLIKRLSVVLSLSIVSLSWLVLNLVRRIVNRNKQGTNLCGPPSKSFVFGVTRQTAQCLDLAALYQEWAAKYGPVFQTPTALGGYKFVLCDPKAVSHFYTSERSVYVKDKLRRKLIANMFGRGILWAEGETHKRQRKALTPAFSNAAIRGLTAVFYDSAYKLKNHWDTTLDNSADGAVIDVEQWLNRLALDSIGIAGFSHDFRTLDGEYSTVAAAFASFEGDNVLSKLLFAISIELPFLFELPNKRSRLMRDLRRTMSVIADELLENMRREKKTHVTDETAERSVIGLLLKAEEEEGSEFHMEKREVVARYNTLLVAGNETTSITLTWVLIELARNPKLQTKLREELERFGATDPTWDQLVSNLPYLDAVILEVLRLHPPVGLTHRQAQVDDVIPIGEPITTKSGERVDSIAVTKGTIVTVSIRYMNTSTVFWGPNAKDFVPERWLTLTDDPVRAKEIQGHRHLLTFVDGPRTCLGKQFALAELRAVLFVLIKNYTFEFPAGPQTEIGTYRGLINRPTVLGQVGACVPLKMRRVE
ncbi:cytochrome P450 [Mycena crocata]|nr:cytochrome P450 [Mycena crocata]